MTFSPKVLDYMIYVYYGDEAVYTCAELLVSCTIDGKMMYILNIGEKWKKSHNDQW